MNEELNGKSLLQLVDSLELVKNIIIMLISSEGRLADAPVTRTGS